ncbi:Endothelin precursor [Eptesipox virus]|uniref:Endothelin n=1 Tax=Eptesipox virus TaxID=1329402 RepID=A0A220T6P3_9POXV|nr:Endothelin precursor [Eptesipox virus]ASK51373.1 Endothelin precursor [Eptesipox virus]WAH71131.1 endothelin precursor [Eptesipox virus]
MKLIILFACCTIACYAAIVPEKREETTTDTTASNSYDVDITTEHPSMHIPKSRRRRCACSNPNDKECLKFCDMDVIW